MMTLLDEYTRQSLAIQVERQLTATQVLASTGKNPIISYELSSWIDDEGDFFSWGLETEITIKNPCF